MGLPTSESPMLILKVLHRSNTVAYFRTDGNHLLARFAPGCLGSTARWRRLLRPHQALTTRAPGSPGEDQGTPAQPSHTGSRRRTHDASVPGCPGNSVPAGCQFGPRSFPPRCMPTPLLALRYSRRGSWQAASLLFGAASVSLPLPLLPTRHSGCRRATSDPSVAWPPLVPVWLEPMFVRATMCSRRLAFCPEPVRTHKQIGRASD